MLLETLIIDDNDTDNHYRMLYSIKSLYELKVFRTLCLMTLGYGIEFTWSNFGKYVVEFCCVVKLINETWLTYKQRCMYLVNIINYLVDCGLLIGV